MKTSVIADSSGLVSLISQADKNHPIALKVASRFQKTYGSIIVPSDVFAETLNVVGKKLGHNIAVVTGKDIQNSKTFLLIDSNNQIRSLALKKFESHPQGASFTDCIVMAFADYHETKEIFGFDEVFQKKGYTILK